MADFPPSLKVIAEAAGVSVMTVSYALRNDPRIALSTRRRVQEIAVKMGYRRDPAMEEVMRAVRERKRGRGAYQGTLAYLNYHSPKENLLTPFSAPLLAGARDTAAQFGYQLEEAWVSDPNLSPARVRQILRAKGIVGLLLPTPPKGICCDWDWDGFSAVAMTRTLPELSITRVVINHFANMVALLHKLEKMGRQRILLITSPNQEETASYHSVAAFEWFHRYVLKKEPQILMRSVTEVYKNTELLLLPDGVDAVIASATFLLEGIRGVIPGKQMPEGVKLVMSVVTESGYSGIDPQMRKIGQVAVETLIAQLGRHEYGLPVNPVTTMIEGLWVER